MGYQYGRQSVHSRDFNPRLAASYKALQCDFTYSKTDIPMLYSISELEKVSSDDRRIQYFQLFVSSCHALFTHRRVASADLIHRLVMPDSRQNPDDDLPGPVIDSYLSKVEQR
jgi:hypothetical protein